MGAGPPPFEPHPWLGGFLRQTLAGALLRGERLRAADLRRRSARRWLRVDEHTEVRVSALAPAAGAHWLVLVHGLAGSADSPYILGTARKAAALGLGVARLDLRNAGGSEARTPTLYHGGLVDDLAALVSDFATTRPDARLHLCGFSLGGNIALKLAASWGADPPANVASVSAVAPALDLTACSRRLDGDRSLRLVRDSFLRSLRGLVRRKARHFPEAYPLDGLDDLRTLYAFDDRWIARGFGFDSAADYYRRASALPDLPRLALPTRIVHTSDDRLVPFAAFRRPELRDNPHVQLVSGEGGGHCAFVARRRGRDADRFWAENRVVEFVRALSC